MPISLATWLRLFGGVALLLGNSFFVTTEFAMTRVRQFEAEAFLGDGRGLERAWNMTKRLEIFLTGCQVGITICSVGLGVVAEPAVTAVLDPLLGAVGVTDGGHTALSVLLALAVVNLMHVIVGEQAPTYLGIERAKFVAGYGSGPLYVWTKLMYPVIIAADWVAKALLGLFGVEISRSWLNRRPKTLPQPLAPNCATRWVSHLADSISPKSDGMKLSMPSISARRQSVKSWLIAVILSRSRRLTTSRRTWTGSTECHTSASR